MDSPVLGRAKEEFHRLLGRKKSPASVPNTLHQLQGVKPTPKILLPVPPSCHTSHLLPHIQGLLRWDGVGIPWILF